MIEQIPRQKSDNRLEQRESGEISFKELTVYTRQHAMEMKKAQESVRCAYEVFVNQGCLCSDDCDYLLAFLDVMRDAIQTTYKLYEDVERLPARIRTKHYQLTAELLTAKERITRLVQLVIAFRPRCKAISSHAIRQHYTIICGLEALLDSTDKIVFSSQFLLDRTRFPEHS